MKRLIAGLLLAAAAFGALAQEKPTALPQGLGLPVLVRAALNFVELADISENDGVFKATVDLRLRWQDPRLAFPREQEVAGYQEFTDAEAEARLAKMWQPRVDMANMKDKPTYSKLGLRIYPDGRVELMQRATAAFTADYALEKFPFDRQKLGVELISRAEPVHRLLLDFRQDDLEFSNTRSGKETDGWTIGLVELSKGAVPAWRGDSNPSMRASLVVKRDQKSLLATIFVPLIASLVIPLLVLWLNKSEDGGFEIDAFELTNISIGGLFAVVALNFTVNSSFVKLATGDNPVMRLFALNYFLLGLSLVVGILLYRFNGMRRLLGPFVQEEFFVYINWAIPVLTFGTAAAMVGMALF